MDETEHDRGDAPMEDRGPSGPDGPREAGEGRPAGAPPPWAGGVRRRRGRRGRGGRGPVPPFRPGGPEGEEDEGSSQTREVAAYERRQRQGQQRGGWRGGSAARPWSGGGGRPSFGGPRPPYGARPGAGRPQRYQEMVRRTTAGPRAGPPEEPGEPIAGPHAVLEALRAGRAIRRIYVAQERGARTGAVSDLVREAQERRVPLRFVDRMEVQRLSPGVEHQGIVAIAEGRQGVELDELLLHLETVAGPPLVLLVDSLQDPQNFGVLLRSAEGAGVDGVVVPRHRQVGLTPAVARTSAGASEHLLIADVANLRQAIDALKERGVWVVGTDESGDLEWDAVDYRGPTAVVVGGEAEGMRRLVLEGCDQVVRIPMQGQVSSLNAAAAGTVVLFEALRQRMRDAAPPVVEGPRRGEPARDDEASDAAPTDDLLVDGAAPAGDDDDDVGAGDEPAEDERGQVDTDVMDAMPPGPAAGSEADLKPARTRKRTSAPKRAPRKKREG